ncbi:MULTISPECIES: LuxR C-terminal-related transcriptional regulator [Actinokineospora]|uniref:LuxR C-terminal-related transcriptional regulator n=1 Tax=Actinokineospora TaxID=39845 RepID=UPI0016713F1F|nr:MULTISPECIES: LuxR C-terminal-related transcriptional regulator [Actinokineospora]UVS79187.1 Response regulator protein VraR [Actinokineospora sp. UTMC 2448]
MGLLGVGVLRAVLATGLAALGWTCVADPATAAQAALIIPGGGMAVAKVVAECAARAIPTVVLGSVRSPQEMIIAVHAGATGVVDRDLPVLDLLDAVQGALTATGRRDGLLDALRGRLVLQDRIDRLTGRERAVLAGLASGRAAAEIARRDQVSIATVRAHIRSILHKLDVPSQLAAVAEGRRGWRELNLADHDP